MSGPWNSNSSASFPPSLTPSVLTAPCPSSSSSGRVMGQSWRALMNCTGAHYHHHDLSGPGSRTVDACVAPFMLVRHEESWSSS